jgi:hypothetical protein
MNEDTPISTILMAFQDLEFLACEFRCISVAYESKDNNIYFPDEMTSVSKAINIFKEMNPNHLIFLNLWKKYFE